MRKFPSKFKYPLMISMVLPTMLLSMPAIITYKSMPQDGEFIALWFDTIVQVVPSALILLAVVAPTIRVFVSTVLIEQEADN
ncbi:DUF2798 domain-containing protein [Shewanella sp. H8]|uniref:DUF2798 domain-containing protein n=1 Tax=Shewanella sp. H8 TaxID=3342676 RepID=UPI003314B174